ncbi:hypothetical protein ABZ896_23530 [Streptomyces sp. NPDC047072]|uniref:hypothetical protein n=1 Tax=Streptomyces sp. NPDC047072 TaxID=3154809 RepID=UPI00340632E1
MAGRPSDTEILEAVGAHAGRRGIAAGASDPGVAVLSWQTLLDFRIVRSVETRGERAMRQPGTRREELADRPTYTSISSHRITPPADPSRTEVWLLVRRASLGEEWCEDCDGGTNLCGACGGRGGRECPRFVDCPACHGGPDSCWECEGTGRSRSRRPAHLRPGTTPADRAARVRCERCRTSDAACPKCRGRRQLDCPDCGKSGYVQCGVCAGTKRVTHQECEGTGRFTVWTEGWIHQNPHHEKERRLGRLDLRRTTANAGRWQETVLRTATDKLPDDLDEADRTLLTPYLARRDGEVARHATLRRLPLAHVTLPADPHHVYYAFPTHSGIEVTTRPTGERVRYFAVIAAASVAVVALVAILATLLLR